MQNKTCAHCKQEYPATSDYFHKKLTKAGTVINGRTLRNDCNSLRHICKSCHTIKATIRRQTIRARELNISLEEYQLNIKEITRELISKAAIKHPEFAHLSRNERARKIAIKRMGYTVEEYDTKWREKHKQATIARRKYIYEGDDDTYPLVAKARNKKILEANAPSRVALNMKISVKDLTPELLKMGIERITLKRQMKQQRYGKKENTI